MSRGTVNQGMKMHSTRFDDLCYANFNTCWTFVDFTCSEDGDSIGPRYSSKEELLADLTRFGSEWSGTNV